MDDFLEFTTVCPCCIPGAIVAIVVTTWLVTTVASSVIGLIAKEDSFIHRALTWISYIFSFLVVLVAVFLGSLQSSESLRSFFFAQLCSGMGKDPAMTELRCNHVGDVGGRVLEIGPGPGANFKCWGDNNITEWVGVEPNNYFEPMIEEQKGLHNLTFPTRITWLKGEKIDVEPESFDYVVATHVLCSVDSIDTVLGQITTALKPGGKFMFIEHVVSEEKYSSTWVVQQLISPFLYIVGNGCQFVATGDYIRKLNSVTNKLYDIDIKDMWAPIPMPFLKPHVIGSVTKL